MRPGSVCAEFPGREGRGLERGGPGSGGEEAVRASPAKGRSTPLRAIPGARARPRRSARTAAADSPGVGVSAGARPLVETLRLLPTPALQAGPRGSAAVRDRGKEGQDGVVFRGCSRPRKTASCVCARDAGGKGAAALQPWTIILSTEDGKLMPSKTEDPFCITELWIICGSLVISRLHSLLQSLDTYLGVLIALSGERWHPA